MFFKSYARPGKGINKEDLDKSGIELYFDIFFRRIWKLMSLNLLYLLASIPAIIISGAISLYFFTLLASAKNIPVKENSSPIAILSVLLAIIFFQVVGSGPATVAKSYVLRKFVNDNHAWVVSDFFENIRKNFKQGIAVYIINTISVSALLISWYFYSFVIKNNILSMGAVIIFLIFATMQTYVHQLVASMKLKVRHIYKNALMLTLIKLPWNALMTAITALFIYCMFYLALKIPAACVAITLAIYFAIVSFTQIFMTNNIMNKYIIQPGISEENRQNS